MFGTGLPELILIMLVVLLVFGPEKMPEIAKNLGDMVGKIRKTSDKLKSDLYSSVDTLKDSDSDKTEKQNTETQNTEKNDD